VGVVALALEDDVAGELKITDEVKAKLQELADRRLDEATDLALEVKDLPAAQQRLKLAPFVAESERLGLELLTAAQRTRLEQIRLARAGMASLKERNVSGKLKLTLKQRADVDSLLEARDNELGKGTEEERRLVKARYERDLSALLTREQRLAWEQLAGLSPGGADAAETASADAKPTVADSDKPATKPAVDDEPPATPEKPIASTEKPASPVPASGEKPAPGDDPSRVAVDEPLERTTRPGEKPLLRFNFAYQPWKDVLEWFAKEADLSLEPVDPPQGTLNYKDRSKGYTPDEALDVINQNLLLRGYTLVRRERQLFLFNLENDIPDQFVDLVTPDELDSRAKYELVRCMFSLRKMTPEEAQKEIEPLKGPQCKIALLPQTRQIIVRETVVKLRLMRDIIRSVEDPEGTYHEKIVTILLQFVVQEDVLMMARPLMGIPDGQWALPDGSLRIAPEPFASRIVATGRPDKIERLKEIAREVDKETSGSGAVIETPQFVSYSTAPADPASVFAVLQTLLAGSPDVRLSLDEKAGKIAAWARPTQHATIIATINEMKHDGGGVEVFTLRRVDPQTAAVAIQGMFGSADKETAATAPKVYADPSLRQLLVRGTKAQIDQIRELLRKMGEEDEKAGSAVAGNRGNYRLLPYTGRQARNALESTLDIWEGLGKNRIRVVTRGSRDAIRQIDRTVPPGAQGSEAEGTGTQAPNGNALPSASGTSSPETKNPETKATDEGATETKAAPRATGVRPRDSSTQRTPARHVAPVQLTSFQANDESDAPATEESQAPERTPVRTAEGNVSQVQPARGEPSQAKPSSEEPAEIIVTIGPSGVVIASSDTKALDDFERLFEDMASRTAVGGREYTVLYLKYARAEVAALLLQEMMGGSSSSSSSGGSLMGDIGSMMLGDVGGGLLGALGGGSGGSDRIGVTVGTLRIVPDARLNALVVQGSVADVEMVEQLLEVIDQEAGPIDVETQGKPRFIPVYNTSAEEVASIVRTVYASRITTDGTSQQNRQPSPEDFIRALSRRGGRNTRDEVKSEPSKMTLGVDVKSNSLIVSAPEPLFQEVKGLVEQLDQGTPETDQTVGYVTLKHSSPQVVQQALASMTGGSVQANITGGTQQQGTTASRTGQTSRGTTFQPGSTQNQGRYDFLNALRSGGSNGQSIRFAIPGQSSSGFGSGFGGGFRSGNFGGFGGSRDFGGGRGGDSGRSRDGGRGR
jgi:type II secretory pathway component GspD/PulD (secretin)